MLPYDKKKSVMNNKVGCPFWILMDDYKKFEFKKFHETIYSGLRLLGSSIASTT